MYGPAIPRSPSEAATVALDPSIRSAIEIALPRMNEPLDPVASPPPEPSPEQKALAARLHDHGDKSDLIESRAAFAEKRKPNFKGWLDPQDRYRMPKLDGK